MKNDPVSTPWRFDKLIVYVFRKKLSQKKSQLSLPFHVWYSATFFLKVLISSSITMTPAVRITTTPASKTITANSSRLVQILDSGLLDFSEDIMSTWDSHFVKRSMCSFRFSDLGCSALKMLFLRHKRDKPINIWLKNRSSYRLVVTIANDVFHMWPRW